MEFGLQGHMQEWVGEDWDEDRNYYNLKKKERGHTQSNTYYCAIS